MSSRFSFKIKALSASIILTVLLSASVSGAGGVLIVGDSMMKSVAREFKKECASRKLSTETFTSIGSGLARLDLLDWHVEVAKLVAEHKPETVLVMIGANDNQAMQGGGGTFPFGTSGWEIEYGRRCGKLMDVIIDGGASEVVWFGLPCMREKKLDHDAQTISRIVKQQAAARPKVRFVSTYKMFSKKNKYSAYIIQKSGMPLDVRADDGIHFNRNGAKYLVERVSSTIFKK